MSRSFKKKMYHSTKGDSSCRKIYHKNKRSKYNVLLSETKKYLDSENDIPTDFIMEDKDYTVKMSDKWSWCSDGGSYLNDTVGDVRRGFNWLIQNYSEWNEILAYDCSTSKVWIKRGKPFSHTVYTSTEILEFVKKYLYSRMKLDKNLLDYLIAHQEEIVVQFHRIKYGK